MTRPATLEEGGGLRLLEDGGTRLLEDGGERLLEGGPPPCLPLVNDAGAVLLLVGDTHCALCRPQPFRPLLAADSELRTVRVPTQNNVIDAILAGSGAPLTLVNEGAAPLALVTTALILSKHDAELYGHYLSWSLRGEDAPFRVEAVAMEFATTRGWDAP